MNAMIKQTTVENLTIGCHCGRSVHVPAGTYSFFGDLPGDTGTLHGLLLSNGWQSIVKDDTWYARCGQCDVRWPHESGGNARQRRGLRRAFRPTIVTSSTGVSSVNRT